MNGRWPTPSYHDARAVGQTSNTCSAIEGSTISSASPCVTRTGSVRSARTSSPSISRANSAPRTLGRHDHVPAQRRAPVVGVERLDGAGAQEAPDRLDARGQVGAAGVARVLEEAGTDVLEGGRAQHRAAGEVEAGDGVLAIGPQVVGDDEPAVGPGDDHGPIELQLLDDGVEIVGPQPRIEILRVVDRLLGHAMAAKVERDDPEAIGQRSARLSRPAHLGLGPAMDEQERRAMRVAPLLRVQPEPAAAADVVGRDRIGRVHRRPASRCLLRPMGGVGACAYCSTRRYGRPPGRASVPTRNPSGGDCRCARSVSENRTAAAARPALPETRSFA